MEKIGAIIRNKRTEKGLTQEELGKKLFVTKQAVSKWENDRTLPDIETIRKLCEILNISHDEILGGSIENTKQSNKRSRISITVALICLLGILLLAGKDISEYIDRRTQSGVAYIYVCENNVYLSTDDYTVAGIKAEALDTAYQAKVGYGELRGTITVHGIEIDFGFVNTNNWHNIQIRIDLNGETVTQSVAYKTDGKHFDTFTTTAQIRNTKSASVFREGA